MIRRRERRNVPHIAPRPRKHSERKCRNETEDPEANGRKSSAKVSCERIITAKTRTTAITPRGGNESESNCTRNDSETRKRIWRRIRRRIRLCSGGRFSIGAGIFERRRRAVLRARTTAVVSIIPGRRRRKRRRRELLAADRDGLGIFTSTAPREGEMVVMVMVVVIRRRRGLRRVRRPPLLQWAAGRSRRRFRRRG